MRGCLYVARMRTAGTWISYCTGGTWGFVSATSFCTRSSAKLFSFSLTFPKIAHVGLALSEEQIGHLR